MNKKCWYRDRKKTHFHAYLGSCLECDINDIIKKKNPINAARMIQNIMTIESKIIKKTVRHDLNCDQTEDVEVAHIGCTSVYWHSPRLDLCSRSSTRNPTRTLRTLWNWSLSLILGFSVNLRQQQEPDWF